MKKIFPLFLSICTICLVFVNQAQAFTMSNLLYIIKLGNLNNVSGLSQSSSRRLTFTSGETGAGYYSGGNWKLCAGFYGGIICNRQKKMFSLTISSTRIDFGILEPNNPSDRTNTLTVSDTGESSATYAVTANESNPLSLYSKESTIPDTTCDNGLCTSTTSGPWVLSSGESLTFGFGYRCDNVTGSECASGFTNATYFKQFSASPSAQTVMSGGSGNNQSVQITYRVNVSPSQAAGDYTNNITYIAIPTF